MKKTVILFLIVMMASTSVFAQAGQETAVHETKAEPVSLMVKDDSKYVNMSMDELYQEALKEGGEVIVYSVTGNASKAADKFKTEYPGITVTCSKINSTNMWTKVNLEGESGSFYCDLILNNDGTYEDYMEWYSKGYVIAYIPTAIENDLREGFHNFATSLVVAPYIWFYNTKAFPNGCPLTNIWDIVEMDGNRNSKYQICLQDLSNTNLMGLFCYYIDNADILEAQYKEKYGKKLEYTYDADELGVAKENNAGYEWVYRLLQCNYSLFSDGNEQMAAVHNSTADKPAITYSSAAKYGEALSAGQNIGLVTTIADKLNGVTCPTFMYLVKNTDNPAAARLFAYYLLGGEDGQSNGMDKIINREGTYPTRNSISDYKYNKITLDETNVGTPNAQAIYDEVLNVKDFCAYYADKFAK